MRLPRSYRKWETKPLDCWPKAKELRQSFYQELAAAKDRGKLLVHGHPDGNLLYGIPENAQNFYNPYGASIAAASDPFSRACMARSEIGGYGRDICAYNRNALGAMFLNRDLLGSEYPTPDFIMGLCAMCDMHNKNPQVMAEHFGLPLVELDTPGYIGPENADRSIMMQQYRIDLMHDAIEQMEKITGQGFDDERFIAAVRAHIRIAELTAETLDMQRNIPAPLDAKTLFSLFILGGLIETDLEETQRFWETLRDEVKNRVDKQIAGLATERYRWIDSCPPPWYFLELYRYLEKYGAVCLGSPMYVYLTFRWQGREDEVYGAKGVAELPLNTRDDAIKAVVKGWGIRGGMRHSMYLDIDTDIILGAVKAFHVDGAILALWRSCMYMYLMKELRLVLTKAGTPSMLYEGAMGDKTDLDEARVFDQVDTFMESQGLAKLED